MKIKMKIKYRKAWLFITGAILVLSLLLIMAISFISEERNYGLAFLCLFLGVIILIPLYFRFNYGITITEKRVVAIEQAGIKILRYGDISGITVRFTNESVTAYVKMKDQQEYVINWDYIFLGTNVVLPSKNNIKLYDEFVEKSIIALSLCPKVKIQDLYTPK